MRENKRGQVTLFIILAIVIVAIIILGIFFWPNIIGKIRGEETISDQIKEITEFCLKKEGVKAVYLAGLRGGKSNPEELITLNLDETEIDITVLYKEGSTYLNSILTIEESISDIIELEMEDCIIEGLVIIGADITEIRHGEQGKPVVIIKIDGKISLKMDYNIVVIEEDQEVMFNQFEQDLLLDIKDVYDDALNILEKTSQNQDKIDITALLDRTEITIIELSENEFVYTIEKYNVWLEYDPELSELELDKKPYMFMFAVQL
jgi:hypothetical protein